MGLRGEVGREGKEAKDGMRAERNEIETRSRFVLRQ
jgi:hypothetical protein